MKSHPFPLTAFKTWLEAQGRATTTITNYASLIRGVLRSPEEATRLLDDPELAREAFAWADAELPRGSRHVLRAAARALDAFLKAHGKAGFDPAFHGGAPKIDPFENHPLTPLLRQLTEDSEPTLPLHRIPNLKWKHVQKHWNGGYGVLDPVWGRMYRVPHALLIEINKWVMGGNPKHDKEVQELPFIPREPLSKFPMPSAMLRKLSCA
jgi:hypothetical protein